MPHTLTDTPRFPSRRALRKARELEQQGAPEGIDSVVGSDSVSEGVGEGDAGRAVDGDADTGSTGSTTPKLPVGVLLTPAPTFAPTPSPAQEAIKPLSSSDNGSRPSKRDFARRLVGGTFAIATVAALTTATVLPVFAGESEPEVSEVRVEQQLQNSGMVDPSATLNAIGSVEIGADPSAFKQIKAEADLVDPATLEDTDLRMPFDRDWPLTDGFAYRTAPVEQFHDAQDIAAADGTPVLAIGSGRVMSGGYSSDGCGFGVKIQHKVNAETVTSRYCHMQVDSHNLKAGDMVKIGDPIGRVGNTGMSFGAHLHLSLRRSGVPIDPLPYIQDRIARQTALAEKQTPATATTTTTTG